MGEKKVSDAAYVAKLGRTICEVHREIYDIVEEELHGNPYYDEVLDKLQEAYGYAKKMDAKLRQYKNNYDDDWWEKERKEIVQEKLQHRSNRQKNT
jgi:hypothetical protein